MLPKKYIKLESERFIEDGDIFPIRSKDLRVLSDHSVYVYSPKGRPSSCPEWIIKFDNGDYLLYSTRNSKKIKMVRSVDSSYILLKYVGHKEYIE